MSKIEVNTIDNISGSSTLNLGSTNTSTIAAPAGTAFTNMGKIGQVVSAETSTETNVTGTTYADTGLSASITPSSTSSKILIMTAQHFQLQRPSSAYVLGGFRLLRGSSAIFQPNPEDGSGSYGLGFQVASATASNLNGYNTINYLDSPSTTSATTYKTQMRAYTGQGQITAQKAGPNANGKSTIILMEILP